MELPETAKRQRSLASNGALSPGGSNKKKKGDQSLPPCELPPPIRPKYTIKILTPLEPFVRCETEWGEFMDSPTKPPDPEDMEREHEEFVDKPEPGDRPESPSGNMSDGQAETPPPVQAAHAMQISIEPSSPAPPASPMAEPAPVEKQICRTRLDKKLIECRYGDRCKFSHDCPRCPGLSHAAFHCPKPLYTIRILGPMVPTPRPSPGATPAFDPLSPYNSSSFLMSSESHPPSREEPADILDWDYGSMDNVPCEYLYGAWMQSPAQIPRPAPQDLLEDEDFVLTSDL